MQNISIIVPVYNVERTLESCISSILMPNLQDLELILVDDASPDRGGNLRQVYYKRSKG